MLVVLKCSTVGDAATLVFQKYFCSPILAFLKASVRPWYSTGINMSIKIVYPPADNFIECTKGKKVIDDLFRNKNDFFLTKKN